VRFDDKLDTVFAQPADDRAAMAAAWMQIVDILAQDRGVIDINQRKAALTRLDTWRQKIPADRRRVSALSLAGRTLPIDLVIFFGEDTAQVAAPLLSTVQLSDQHWLEVIPALKPASRALVRERRDLGPKVQQSLSSFGLSDFALPTAEQQAPIESASSQIKELVARIEAFRRDRAQNQELEPVLKAVPAPQEFRFETGADGLINWVDGAPRGPVVGIEIATMAEIGAHGVDGHAAGAFRRRTPFRNARMVVPGDGDVAGEWLISGIPCFTEHDGRFFGYRCAARRPQRDERPITQHVSLFGNALPADSVRQLVHELRTPLNAIRGFAEMISGQLLGPVSADYRARATAIVSEAAKLLALFEDLDVAAKLERGVSDVRPNIATNVGDVLQAIAADFVALTNARQVHLRFATATNLPLVAVDAVTLERMLTRLLGAVVGLARQGETITASIGLEKGQIAFAIDRPLSLVGQTERDLFDPAYGPEGEWPDAPALGLGFALRLVSNMARATNGRLVVAEERFGLLLPVKGDEAGSTQESR
jgi:His Kinase A (phospho-acceptor) domain